MDDPFVARVVQVDKVLLPVARQCLSIDGIAVILAGYVTASSRQIELQHC